ncbi:MAG: EthD family reductase [Thermomicrobiales bacterium]|nr:EthD family reductase [Thermomicrobiales bacterium]
MFYVVFLVKKKEGMSQEEFVRYWIGEHTPFTAKVPGLREYHCYPMIGFDGATPPVDAIAYIGFDDEAAWRVAEKSPELAESLADAPNFQDVSRTFAFYAEKHVIVG